MFSATWPKEVELLAQEYFNKERTLHVQIGDPHITAKSKINQIVKMVDPGSKFKEFCKLLTELSMNKERIIVFVETRKGVDELLKMLRLENMHGVEGIHGDKNQ